MGRLTSLRMDLQMCINNMKTINNIITINKYHFESFIKDRILYAEDVVLPDEGKAVGDYKRMYFYVHGGFAVSHSTQSFFSVPYEGTDIDEAIRIYNDIVLERTIKKGNQTFKMIPVS